MRKLWYNYSATLIAFTAIIFTIVIFLTFREAFSEEYKVAFLAGIFMLSTNFVTQLTAERKLVSHRFEELWKRRRDVYMVFKELAGSVDYYQSQEVRKKALMYDARTQKSNTPSDEEEKLVNLTLEEVARIREEREEIREKACFALMEAPFLFNSTESDFLEELFVQFFEAIDRKDTKLNQTIREKAKLLPKQFMPYLNRTEF